MFSSQLAQNSTKCVEKTSKQSTPNPKTKDQSFQNTPQMIDPTSLPSPKILNLHYPPPPHTSNQSKSTTANDPLHCFISPSTTPIIIF